MTLANEPPITGTKPPSLEELKDCDDRARAKAGKPEIFSWRKEGKPSYLLSVTYGAGANPTATWILHAGHGDDAAVVWIVMTNDINLINTKLKRAVQQTSSYSMVDLVRSQAADQQKNEPVEAFGNVVGKGTIFAGLYEIISNIGQGGMGTVYKARQTDTNDAVALKILHPHLVTDALSRSRFEQEAQKSELLHRNLVRIHKYGFSETGQPFLAMDYLDGCPLSELITAGPLSLESFTNIFTQVCEGLSYAHSKGVVHRDIKPGNIMICKSSGNDVIKIVDFGIAKTNIVSGTGAKLTPTGEVLGSPLYMSPEQCAGGDPDPRSDIYSLGCVMYEAATGVLPFNHSNPIKLILMQLSERAAPFSESRPGMSFSREQEKIIMKALEKDASKRYQNAEELSKDLWQLTITGGGGPVRVFGGDLKKASSASAEAPAATSDIVDAFKTAGKQRKLITLRFRKLKTSGDKDQILQALELSLRLIKKGADMAIFLDYEAVQLASQPDFMSPDLHTDLRTTERINSIQHSLQKTIRAGGFVAVTQQWMRYFGLPDGYEYLLPNIRVLDDDELAEFLLERASSILDCS